MIKYDLLMLDVMMNSAVLSFVNRNRFLPYLVKETDLQAIGGKLQKRLERKNKEFDDLDAMLRERQES